MKNIVPKRNIIWERSKFHHRSQKDGESVEEFITALYTLSEFCEFPDRDTKIRDRLVIGLKDTEVCKKLQLKEDLTLTKAQEMARNHELIKLQNRQCQEGGNIEAIKRYQIKNIKKGQPRASQTHQSQSRFRYPNTTRHPHPQTKGATGKKCGRCGKAHPWSQSPAFGKTCHKCHKVSHFASMYKTRSVHEVHNDLKQEDEEVDYYIGSVERKPIPPWTTNLQIMGHKIKF